MLFLLFLAAAPIQDDIADLEEFPLITAEEVIETQEIVFDDEEQLDE